MRRGYGKSAPVEDEIVLLGNRLIYKDRGSYVYRGKLEGL